MILVTFTVHERKTVESVDPATTIRDLAAKKNISTNEKIFIDGTPVENRDKTLGDYVGVKAACSFNVITKTNNAAE